MDLTDELARLERRMKELQAETERLTAELERLGQHVPPPRPPGLIIQPDSAEPPQAPPQG
jgi:hypothetical protein